MVTVLVIVVVVGLGVALFEFASSRRSSSRDTRSQLDALSRVVEPQRRGRPRLPGADDDPSDGSHPPSSGVQPD